MNNQTTPANGTPTVALYARLSDDRKHGASIESQLEDCFALAEEQGWQPVEFVDRDISAFSGRLRPAYEAMMAKARTGEITRVVAWDLDRLYRDPRELEDLIALADPRRLHPLRVYDPAGDLNLDTEGGITAARNRVNTANMESRSKSRRVKRAKARIRKQGISGGGPRPFGWLAQQAVEPSGKPAFKKDGTPKVIWIRNQHDPDEVALIKAAVADLLKGASLRDIAMRWNAAKVPQPQTGRANWTAHIVHAIVASPRLAGLLGHRKQVIDDSGKVRYEAVEVVGEAKDIGPPIIDRATWERLQQVLEQRGATGHMPRRRSLLTGLVTCEKCGSVMVRSGARRHNGDAEARKVWRCMAAGGGHPSIDAQALEEWLIEATLHRADTASLAAMVRQRGKQGQEAAELVSQLEELERQMDAAARSYAAGRLPIRAFEEASAELQRKQKAVQSRLGPLTATAPLEPYAGRRGLLRKRWPTLSLDEQRAIIAAALGRVTVGPVRKVGRPTFDSRRVKIAPAPRNTTKRRKT